MVHIYLTLKFDSNITQQLLIFWIGLWGNHYTVTGNKVDYTNISVSDKCVQGL
jgi:hypothetical protein